MRPIERLLLAIALLTKRVCVQRVLGVSVKIRFAMLVLSDTPPPGVFHWWRLDQRLAMLNS